MSVFGIFAPAGSPAASYQIAQPTGHRQHNGQRAPSLSDIDAQGSSVASSPSATGKIGSKINITA